MVAKYPRNARRMHASNLQDVIDIAKWGTGMCTTEKEKPMSVKPNVDEVFAIFQRFQTASIQATRNMDTAVERLQAARRELRRDLQAIGLAEHMEWEPGDVDEDDESEWEKQQQGVPDVTIVPGSVRRNSSSPVCTPKHSAFVGVVDEVHEMWNGKIWVTSRRMSPLTAKKRFDEMSNPPKMRPKELDVPHWAMSMVDNYRRDIPLPERVTNRMIYARLEECRGMNPEDIVESVKLLIEETE